MNVAQARAAGAAAFADGQPRIAPIGEFVVPGAMPGETDLRVWAAWYSGWDEANLAAPI